jgi:ATP-binding cassette, subfamily B, bacterial PglK
MKLLTKVRSLLSSQDKLYLGLLLIISLIVSILETFSLATIMPFVSIASNPILIEQNKYLFFLYGLFDFRSHISFIYVFGIFVAIFFIIRSIVFLVYNYALSRFSQNQYKKIINRLYQNYLYRNYLDFTSVNSSRFTKAIINEAANLTAVLSASLLMISEIMIALLIYSILLLVNWKITVMFSALILIKSLILTQTISKKIKNLGSKRAKYQADIYQVLGDSFGNYKMIKLVSNYDYFFSIFDKISKKFEKINYVNMTLQKLPRLILETVGFCFVIFLILFLFWDNDGDISKTLPIVSMFVVALYRLLPSITRILGYLNDILFHQKALDIVCTDLSSKTENLGEEQVIFKNSIKLSGITFNYGRNEILDGLNLSIQKGEKIAIVGESGSGKSTLIDILLGLLICKKGKLLIDNKPITSESLKSWRSKIGYIPQHVYLLDGTIAENVVFGRNHDELKLIQCLKKANIWNHISNGEGILTQVGEGGSSLSGGQKQRVAIARALYGDPELLILDEATSALDEKIEAKIMKEIYSSCKDKTLIIVAHRLSTLDGCERRIVVENKMIKEIARCK